MAVVRVEDLLKMLPAVAHAPGRSMHVSYDAGADVLYITFDKGRAADDSELTDENVIVRYDGEEVIGYTILNASRHAEEQKG
jgi:uncharacterized protein YuzE